MGLHTAFALSASVQESDQAVIGADVELRAEAGGQSAARGAHTRIDDADVNRSVGVVGRAAGEDDCAFADVLRGDEMSDIDDVNLGGQAQDDAFQCAYICIAQTEVGEEGDEAGHGGPGEVIVAEGGVGASGGGGRELW